MTTIFNLRSVLYCCRSNGCRREIWCSSIGKDVCHETDSYIATLGLLVRLTHNTKCKWIWWRTYRQYGQRLTLPNFLTFPCLVSGSMARRNRPVVSNPHRPLLLYMIPYLCLLRSVGSLWVTILLHSCSAHPPTEVIGHSFSTGSMSFFLF